jgi:thioredoxin reductase (NADPH)
MEVTIIGAGPAGLQAAIYSASEGMETLVVEGNHIGGQIHDTPKLENFAGQSPHGVSGPAFTRKLRQQALSLGATFKMANVTSIKSGSRGLVLKASGELLRTRTAIIATGVTYNVPTITGLQQKIKAGKAFVGPFRCMSVERGKTYTILGGGNSAGQAILSLSSHAKRVYVLTRSMIKMSQYLQERISKQKNVQIVTNAMGQAEQYMALADYTFVCAGNSPNVKQFTNLSRDAGGYIRTDAEYRTSMPGVYAIGDVRANVKRRSVGNAIGDASACTAFLHDHLDSGLAPRSTLD